MAEQTSLTVMVVDDHPIRRDAVARDLAASGFTVAATADGAAAARRRAEVVKPDVVLMDMRLADGDGVQATIAVLEVSPRLAGAGAVGLRRTRRRAAGREGRRARVSGEKRLKC